MTVVRGVILTLRFLLELAMLAAFAYWGFWAGSRLWESILLAVAVPAVVAVVWGSFMSPKARFPLPRPWHALVEIVLFGLAAAALFVAGHLVIAVVLGVLAVLNEVSRQLLVP